MNQSLLDALRTVRRRVLLQMLVRRVGAGFGLWLLAALAILGFDAAWSLVGARFASDPFEVAELPVGFRVAASACLGLGGLWAISRFYLPGSVRHRPLAHYAGLVEARLAIVDGHLTDAAHLAEQIRSGTLEDTLAERACRRAGLTLAHSDLRRLGTGPGHALLQILCTLTAVAVVVLPPALWAPAAEIWRTHPVGRTIWRYLDPTGDHPPASPLTIVPIDGSVFWHESDRIRAYRGGGYDIGPICLPRSPERARITVAWQDGRRDVIDVAVGHQACAWTTIPVVTMPLRYVIHADNSRSRWVSVAPMVVPTIDSVSVFLRSGGRVVPLSGSGERPIRAVTGAALIIDVVNSPPEARLTHPRAEANHLVLPVRRGPQSVELRVAMPDGTESPAARRLEVIGLPQAQIDKINAELAGGEPPPDAIALPVAADALAGAVALPPSDAVASADLSSGQQADSESTGETDGEPEPGADGTGKPGTGTSGGPTDSALIDAVGVIASEHQVSGERLQEMRRFADAAPPAYRDLVAEYFLHLPEHGQ